MIAPVAVLNDMHKLQITKKTTWQIYQNHVKMRLQHLE